MADFKLLTSVIHKNRLDLAQSLQGLSYMVCSSNIAKIFRTQIICSSFWDIRH